MKLWKFYLIVAVVVAILIGLPASIYMVLKKPPSVNTAIDVFACDLVNLSGTLTLKGSCAGQYIAVTSFYLNKTYVKYNVTKRLALETTAENLWAGMTTVAEIVNKEERTYVIVNWTYRKTPEEFVPPVFRAALTRISRNHPWFAESYIINGGIFRGLVRDPASGDQVVGQVFTALMPICGQKRDVGLGGGIINKYDACSFTALFLINKSKLVVLDVYVELINVEDGIEVDAGRSGVLVRGNAIALLENAVQDATKQLEEIMTQRTRKNN